MRCHHSVKQYDLRARSTHGVHHEIVEVNIVIGVVLGELHVVVRVHVPLVVVCDEAVIGLTLGLIALVVIVVFVVAIFHRILLYWRYTVYTFWLRRWSHHACRYTHGVCLQSLISAIELPDGSQSVVPLLQVLRILRLRTVCNRTSQGGSCLPSFVTRFFEMLRFTFGSTVSPSLLPMYNVITALWMPSWLIDKMVVSKNSAELGSALEWIEDSPVPILLSKPLASGDEHLDTGCPLLANSCIMILPVEYHVSIGLSINLSYHFSSFPVPKNDQSPGSKSLAHDTTCVARCLPTSSFGFCHPFTSLHMDMKMILPLN